MMIAMQAYCNQKNWKVAFTLADIANKLYNSHIII